MADERTYVYALVLIVGFVALIAMIQIVDFKPTSSVGQAYGVDVQENARTHVICDGGIYLKGMCLYVTNEYVDATIAQHDDTCLSLGALPITYAEGDVQQALQTMADTKGCLLYPAGGVSCFPCMKEVYDYGNGANGR